ncbi:MAG: hypothetical protein ABGY75_03325 [Gemmataceae bacterium]
MTSEATTTRDADIPELETRCEECKGQGYFEAMYENAVDPCGNCFGAGYIPTALGRKVWAFFRHQSRATVEPGTGANR